MCETAGASATATGTAAAAAAAYRACVRLTLVGQQGISDYSENNNWISFLAFACLQGSFSLTIQNIGHRMQLVQGHAPHTCVTPLLIPIVIGLSVSIGAYAR